MRLPSVSLLVSSASWLLVAAGGGGCYVPLNNSPPPSSYGQPYRVAAAVRSASRRTVSVVRRRREAVGYQPAHRGRAAGGGCAGECAVEPTDNAATRAAARQSAAGVRRDAGPTYDDVSADAPGANVRLGRRFLQRPVPLRRLEQRSPKRMGLHAERSVVRPVLQRSLDRHRLRIHLGLERSLRLGDRSLRPLGLGRSLGLGAEHDLGPVVGAVARGAGLRRLGARRRRTGRATFPRTSGASWRRAICWSPTSAATTSPAAWPLICARPRR